MDSLREGGHTVGEAFQFLDYLSDQEDQAQRRREFGVASTVGLDLGPRRGGFLRRLLGGR